MNRNVKCCTSNLIYTPHSGRRPPFPRVIYSISLLLPKGHVIDISSEAIQLSSESVEAGRDAPAPSRSPMRFGPESAKSMKGEVTFRVTRSVAGAWALLDGEPITSVGSQNPICNLVQDRVLKSSARPCCTAPLQIAIDRLQGGRSR